MLLAMGMTFHNNAERLKTILINYNLRTVGSVQGNDCKSTTYIGNKTGNTPLKKGPKYKK